MRGVLIADHRTSGNASARLLQAKVMRGFARHGRRGPTADVIRTMREVELLSPAGLVVGKTGAFEPNVTKLERVCGQIVRGLYRYHAGERLPESHGVAVYIVSAFTPQDSEQRDAIEQLIAIGLGGNVREQGDVFTFDYRLIEPGSSAWVMQFYGAFAVIASTLSKTSAPSHIKLW